jgi:hypothetical protein
MGTKGISTFKFFNDWITDTFVPDLIARRQKWSCDGPVCLFSILALVVRAKLLPKCAIASRLSDLASTPRVQSTATARPLHIRFDQATYYAQIV